MAKDESRDAADDALKGREPSSVMNRGKDDLKASASSTGDADASELIPPEGQHALIIGQNGSGKTKFASWLMERMPGTPIVIYDTKGESSFLSLPKVAVVTNFDNVLRAADNELIDFVVFRPPVNELADADVLDHYLLMHYHMLKKVSAYIDEIYSFHRGGRSGPGLTALLTRGRSDEISTIMSTQRPRYLTNFALSEAKNFYVFNLTFREDQKRMADIIPEYDEAPKLPEFGFVFYKSGAESYRIYGPISLEKKEPESYTSEAVTAETLRRSNWL